MWLLSAIAILLSLGSTALAQGSIGGDQSSCASTPPWKYRGCYNDDPNVSATRHAGFNWQFLNNPNSQYYYPGYSGLMNVTFCQKACRGHGFRFSALYTGSECYCASVFPNPAPPTSGNSSSGPGPLPPTTNAPVADLFCTALRCPGDASQYCGGVISAAVYEDPSFSNDTSLQSPANYLYLGCYQYASPGAMYAVIKTPSTISCETYCGQLGYPYSARTGIDSDTGSTTCGCGTEIQAGLQLTDETKCRYGCNGASVV